MTRSLPILILLALLLCCGVIYAQQTVAIPVPAQTLTATIPPNPTVATAAEVKVLRDRVAALEAKLDKVLALEVIPANAAAVTIGSQLK